MKRFSKLFFGLLLPLVGSEIMSGSAASFEIDGVITETKTVNGQTHSSDSWFVVIDDENKFRIQAEAKESTNVVYRETGILTNGSYLLTMFNTNRTTTEYIQIENGQAKTIKLEKAIRPINDA